MHSVENIPRYTADTVGRCDNLVYYLVMHPHVKPDSTVDTLQERIRTRAVRFLCALAHCECYMKQDSYIVVVTTTQRSH